MALEDYLVHGKSRKAACHFHGVSTSYMSVSLQKLQVLSQVVADLSPWYVMSPPSHKAGGY